MLDIQIDRLSLAVDGDPELTQAAGSTSQGFVSGRCMQLCRKQKQLTLQPS